MYRTLFRCRVLILTVAVPTAMAAALLAGCTSYGSNNDSKSNTSHPADKQMSAIKAGIIPVADAGGFYVAMARGFFKDRGLNVSEEPIAGGAALVPALESGALDVGFSNILSVIQASEKGLDTKCLTGALKKGGDGEGLALMLASKHKGTISDAAGLDGKTIAVNTVANINQLVAMAWVDANGGDASSLRFVAVNFPDMPAALTEGRVDAAIVAEPFVTIAKAAGVSILDPRPYQAIAETPVFSCWVVTAKWAETHPSEGKAFIAAMKNSADYLKSNPDYLREILPKYMGMKSELASKITLPTITTELTKADYQAWQDAALKFGLIQKRIDPAVLDAGLN